MFIGSNTSQRPNPVRGDMLTNFINISPLQGFEVEEVSLL
jgi:hypothetical protein